jgi:hypothetical protein
MTEKSISRSLWIRSTNNIMIAAGKQKQSFSKWFTDDL